MTSLAPAPSTSLVSADEQPPPPLLVVSGLSLRFGGVAALTDVSFSIAPGELFGPERTVVVATHHLPDHLPVKVISPT